MIGKLFVENGDELKKYDEDAGKEFVEDVIGSNVLFLGHKWYGLPDFETLSKLVEKELIENV